MAEIKNEHYAFFANLIQKETGNIFKEADYYRLESRLNHLKQKYNIENVVDLISLYSLDPTREMLDSLVDSATNNETLFFRDKKPFEALKADIVEEILSNKTLKMVKYWSAASSTGQEAYSIAMTMFEHFPDVPFLIDGTDISPAALDKARNGIYNQLEVQRGMPAKYLIKYFDQLEDKNWQIKSDLRSKVNFRKFNLLSDSINSGIYDIVFCRNVMIYFDNAGRKILLDKIEDSLLTGGKLILGSGESIIGVETKLKQKFYNDLMTFEK